MWVDRSCWSEQWKGIEGILSEMIATVSFSVSVDCYNESWRLSQLSFVLVVGPFLSSLRSGHFSLNPSMPSSF